MKLHRPIAAAVALVALTNFVSNPGQGTLLAQDTAFTAFTYQGRLHHDGNAASGLYEMSFALYDSDTNGYLVGLPQSLSPVLVSNGLFTAALDFGYAPFTGAERWMEITVNVFGSDQPSVTLHPRQAIRPSPYALHAASAAGLSTVSDAPLELTIGGDRVMRYERTANAPHVIGGWRGNSVGPGLVGVTIAGGGVDDGPNIVMGHSGTIGGGQSQTLWPDFATIAGGTGNTIEREAEGAVISGGTVNQVQFGAENSVVAGGVYNVVGVGAYEANIGGGTGNTNLGWQSVIAGGYWNHLSGYRSAIGGGAFNVVSDGGATTVGGGFQNRASGYVSTIAGGYGNVATGPYNAIGGGQGNRADHTGSAVAGGDSNHAADSYSSIGGGHANSASGYASVVAGGGGHDEGGEDSAGNTASGDWSSIGGGLKNTAGARYATVGGGGRNIADGEGAIVAGGGGIYFDGESAGNRAGAAWSTVGGGALNAALGTNSTIAGGSYNVVRGNQATIPGGWGNTADGDYSLAAGTGAQAIHTGAFVWSDASLGSPLISSAANQFTVRAAGGVRFYSDTNGTTGAELAAGSGSWSILSDRKAKENFAAIRTQEILEKVTALPLTTWNYRAQGADVRHLGPTAQDFRAAFGLGESERHINTVDADGVALAAIQGLNRKLEQTLAEQATEIGQLKSANATLEARLAELERALRVLTANPERRAAPGR